jgi:hypothetical protein
MIAGVYNITCQQGSTFSRLLEIEQPDLVTDPTGQTYIPYDLSGYSARMQVRRTIESATTLVTLDTENGGLQINPTEEEDKTHHIRIYMADEVTASISSSGVYDLEIVNDSGEVSRIIQGAFTLSPEVTR